MESECSGAAALEQL